MFHDRGSNSKINRIQERALKLVCKDSGRELEVEREKNLSNHQRNLQLLMIEIYKAKHNISPEFMKDLFSKTITITTFEVIIICDCQKL